MWARNDNSGFNDGQLYVIADWWIQVLGRQEFKDRLLQGVSQPTSMAERMLQEVVHGHGSPESRYAAHASFRHPTEEHSRPLSFDDVAKD